LVKTLYYFHFLIPVIASCSFSFGRKSCVQNILNKHKLQWKTQHYYHYWV